MRILDTYKKRSNRGLKASITPNVSQLDYVIMNTTSNVPNIPIWKNTSLKDLPGEIWKPVKALPKRYLVSSLGRIKSIRNNIILKQSSNTHGYLYVNLTGEKSTQHVSIIHKLVAEAFLGHGPCGMKIVIDHINEIKTDNRAVNLRETTNRKNISRGFKSGTSKYTGVHWDKMRKKWRVVMGINGRYKHIGHYDTELQASEAYQSKVKSLNEP